MPSTTSLAKKLRLDYPNLTFTEGDDFYWSPQNQTVYYRKSNDVPLLLHELSHAALGHADYTRDIELIELEREAWEKAVELAPNYEADIPDDTIEKSLDTYRDWLHARSTCPACRATGVQTKKLEYACLACRTKWRVNDARLCALRRYKLN